MPTQLRQPAKGGREILSTGILKGLLEEYLSKAQGPRPQDVARLWPPVNLGLIEAETTAMAAMMGRLEEVLKGASSVPFLEGELRDILRCIHESSGRLRTSLSVAADCSPHPIISTKIPRKNCGLATKQLQFVVDRLHDEIVLIRKRYPSAVVIYNPVDPHFAYPFRLEVTKPQWEMNDVPESPQDGLPHTIGPLKLVISLSALLGHYRTVEDLAYIARVLPLPETHLCMVDERFFHPHVNYDGSICWGEGQQGALIFCSEFRISDLVDLIFVLLEEYNPQSPFQRLETWDISPACICCGRRVPRDEYLQAKKYRCLDGTCTVSPRRENRVLFWCLQCQNPPCPTCVQDEVPEEGWGTCVKCSQKCSKCGSPGCTNCMGPSTGCIVCGLEDQKLCPTCSPGKNKSPDRVLLCNKCMGSLDQTLAEFAELTQEP